MTGLEEVREYLYQKINKINPENPRANTGGSIIKTHSTDWQENLLDYVGIALQVIQYQFTRSSTQNPAGTAMLTATSTLIGTKISERIRREPLPWNLQVRLGDLFIEAFYNTGYVSLYYPQIRTGSHVISATAKWPELADMPAAVVRINVVGTSTTKPEKITGPTQKSNYRTIQIIKENNKLFNLNTPWVRAIDKLQQVPWQVNKEVYETLLDNKYQFICHLPIENNDAKELKRRSKVMEWEFIIEKANQFKDYERFYQCLEADYRGRLYYSEPFLNYQGSDIARGMLQFADGKELTDSGNFWLAVHTANSYNDSYDINDIPSWCDTDYTSYLKSQGLNNISVDKMTLNDRVTWTQENIGWIIEAGRDHIICSNAEKKVTFLACCIEWLKYSSDPNHKSHLPIPIDGSNNGWQHLAAISKDRKTGELVGLTPIEIQKDFYVETAKELKELTDDERLASILKKMPMKAVRKGISKRGSMTRAYSAGAGKIAENMWFDCKTEDYHETYNLTEDDCKNFAKVLVKAIDNVCPGPLSTMGYLQNLASFEIGKFKLYDSDGHPAGPEHKAMSEQQKKLFNKKNKTEEELKELSDLTAALKTYEYRKEYGNGETRLTWVTPSQFPVKYENFIMNRRKTIGVIAGYTDYSKRGQVGHTALVASKLPDVRGFMCGISPNLIHSLDASHMALVIDNWDGYFGAVHDSFSTHACDVDKLLALTKQEFIKIYDVDNFYNYIEDQLITNKTDLDVEQPQLGELDIQEIYNCEYFFA